MSDLELRILNYVKANPNCRSRDIARAVGVWLCDKEYLEARSHLETLGFLVVDEYADYGNAELYLTYSLSPTF